MDEPFGTGFALLVATFSYWWNHLPPEMTGVIVASVITLAGTLLGVALTQRSATKQLNASLNDNTERQRATLQHNSLERERERQMGLRKEVYGPTFEAIGMVQILLPQWINLDVTDKELNEKIAISSALMAKAQLVSSNTTFAALNKFSLASAEAIAKLGITRALCLGRKVSLERIDARIAETQARQCHLVDLMRNMNIHGGDPRKFEVVNENAEHEAGLMRNLFADRKALQDEQNAALVKMVRDMPTILKPVYELVPPLIVSMRKEIEMPIDDEDAYRREFLEGANVVARIVGDSMDDFERL